MIGAHSVEAGSRPTGHRWTDPATLDAGIRALVISSVGLMATCIIQIAVVWVGQSAALLADALHNLVDVFTSIPLGIAFALSRRLANRRFTYGYARAEDIAGVTIILFIAASAVLAGYAALYKWSSGAPTTHLGLGMAAALAGAIGNELVAVYKIRVGKAIGSAALVADGQHSRADALTSVGAFFGILGVFWGFPWADPLMGLLISAAILYITWEAGHEVFARIMDAIEPETVNQIERIAGAVAGVYRVDEVRARWIGHQVMIELSIEVGPRLTVAEGHQIAETVRHELFHHIPRLADALVHVNPAWEGADPYHALTADHQPDSRIPSTTKRNIP
ncbi:MAG: cation transporter [candidate division NC10 bacterium]|nr:cation transporter [candidate division NC10 bacterium]